MEYEYIWAWCRLNGQDTDYCNSQMETARLAGAPKEAVYQWADGSWAVYDELSSYQRDQLERLLTDRIFGGRPTPLALPAPKPQPAQKKQVNMAKYKPTSCGRLCPFCQRHAEKHGVTIVLSEWCRTKAKCAICGQMRTHEKYWFSRVFFRDVPVPSLAKEEPQDEGDV